MYTQLSYTSCNLEVAVRFSSLLAHGIEGVGYLYAVLGEAEGTGQRVLAFSETQSSRVSIPQERCIHCLSNISQQDELTFFSAVHSNLCSNAILSSIRSGDVVLAYEPPRELALAFTKVAEASSIEIHFVTASFTDTSPWKKRRAWLSVHPNSSPRSMASRLPQGVSVFITNSQITGELQSRISSHLPKSHRQFDMNNILSRTATIDPSFRNSRDIRERLRLASISAEPVSQDDCKAYDVGNLSEASPPPNMAVISWKSTKVVTSTLKPVDSNILFSRYKTYFLVGLAGELGQSLVKWMVDHGARFIVLTSRNPRIDTRWLKPLETRGAVIKIFSRLVTIPT